MDPTDKSSQSSRSNWPDSTPAEAFRSILGKKPPEKDLRYSVFGSDHQIYGPTTEDVLEKWIVEGRVEMDTWIFDGQEAVWKPAAELEAFRRHQAPAAVARPEIHEATFDWLRRIRAFAALDDDELHRLAPHLRKHQAFAKEPLIHRNIDIVTTYFIYSGGVELLMEVDGQLRSLEQLRTGDVFGEQALTGKYPAPYQARSTEISIVFGLRQTDFRSIAHGHPPLAVKLLTSIMADLSLRHVRARERLATAKVLVRGGFGRTGRVIVPVVKDMGKGGPMYTAKGVRKRRITRRYPTAGFDPTYFDTGGSSGA